MVQWQLQLTPVSPAIPPHPTPPLEGGGGVLNGAFFSSSLFLKIKSYIEGLAGLDLSLIALWYQLCLKFHTTAVHVWPSFACVYWQEKSCNLWVIGEEALVLHFHLKPMKAKFMSLDTLITPWRAQRRCCLAVWTMTISFNDGMLIRLTGWWTLKTGMHFENKRMMVCWQERKTRWWTLKTNACRWCSLVH